MDKLFFLGFCISNTLLYVLIKFFQIKIASHSTLEIMGYANMSMMILFIPYLVINTNKVFHGLRSNSGFALNAIAAALKVYAIQGISAKNAAIVSFTQPIFIILLSFITVEKTMKIEWRKYIFIPLSFTGVLIFVGISEIKNMGFIYSLLALHVFLKAFVNIYIKKKSQDKYLGFFYNTLYYAGFGLIVNLTNFIPSMFFNKYVIILAFISYISQFSLIKAYEISEKISLLQNIGYSRIIFTILWTTLIFHESIKKNQTIGILIIAISLILSNLSGGNQALNLLRKKIRKGNQDEQKTLFK